jgi:hypothetical protein
MPATTAAQAPVPQASVSPAPRSNTRSLMCERSTTCMKPAFTRCAKRGWCSICGPCSATGAVSTSSTTCTACGLPIESTATETMALPARVPRARCHFSHAPSGCASSPAVSKGTRAASKMGAPMSTVTRPSAPMRGWMMPASVCTRTSVFSVSLCSLTKRMKQRAPLPHCSTSPPSALWITYWKSMPSAGEGRTVRIWSAPTPKWRSARKRYCAAVRPSVPRVSSSTTKSLPAPCILVKRIRIGGLSPPAPCLTTRCR